MTATPTEGAHRISLGSPSRGLTTNGAIGWDEPGLTDELPGLQTRDPAMGNDSTISGTDDDNELLRVGFTNLVG
jgi:hypothetical protein